MKRYLVGAFLVLVVGMPIAVSQTLQPSRVDFSGGVNFLAGTYYVAPSVTPEIAGDMTVGGDLTSTGIIRADGGLSLTRSARAVEITSPSMTFAVLATDDLIILSSDHNTTGTVPTGGKPYQVITLLSGAGTNTMRFDDGTSTTIGANITMTEGQGDVLTLMCVGEEGDEWVRLFNADN